LKTPPSNIGPRVTPNYEQNLGLPAVYNLPNGGRVFAGQRDEYFYIDLGGVFDSLSLCSVGASGRIDSTKGFNVSTISIEVPIQELTRLGMVPSSPTSPDAVIGGWATASSRSTKVLNSNGTASNSGPWVRVSCLRNLLVNEVVIPLNLKDAFNASSSANDAVFAPFVVDPQLPEFLQEAYGINIPPPPRSNLVAIFAIGIPVNSG